MKVKFKLNISGWKCWAKCECAKFFTRFQPSSL